MKTVDIPPTWESILPELLAVIERHHGRGAQHSDDRAARMVQLTDEYVTMRRV